MKGACVQNQNYSPCAWVLDVLVAANHGSSVGRAYSRTIFINAIVPLAGVEEDGNLAGIEIYFYERVHVL